MRSNIAQWAELHRGGYFANHPRYKNRDTKDASDLEHLRQFGVRLRPEMSVAIIGAGYGREAAIFGPFVKDVYAIEVCPEVFADMAEYLLIKKVYNVMPALAADWRRDVPKGIDLFYSTATFQHMTKDLARDYLVGIAEKLRPVTGWAVIQFAENETGTADAELRAYEPNVRWSEPEIRKAAKRAGLNPIAINTLRGTNRAGYGWAWHWAFIGPAGMGGNATEGVGQ